MPTIRLIFGFRRDIKVRMIQSSKFASESILSNFSVVQEKGGGPEWLWGIIKSMPAALSQKDLATLISLLADEER